MFGYIGIDDLVRIMALWAFCSAGFGSAVLWVVRRAFNRSAVWYEWGLAGALIGACLFPFVLAWLE